MKTLIQKLEPHLLEIEAALWEREANIEAPHRYSDEAFRASIKIFMAGLMDKLWELQEKEGTPIKERGEMALHAGTEIRKIILEMTGIDTHKLNK